MDEARRLDNVEKLLDLPISYEERGKKIGKKIGKELGKELGRIEAKRKFAQKLLHEGFSVEKIAQLTELSEKEIKELTP